MNTTISVVMVSYRTGPVLFEALQAACDDPDIDEIILVDNGNGRNTRKALAGFISKTSRVRLVQGQGNIGFARACNLGAHLSRYEHLLFVNPDALMGLGAAKRLANIGSNLREPWLVGGSLKDIDGKEQRGARRRHVTLRRAVSTFLLLHKIGLSKPIHMNTDPCPGSSIEVGCVSGAFLMTNRASFNILQGFDSAYFLHVEDIDICRRVHALGGQVVYEPRASVMHYGSTSRVPRVQVEWLKLKGFVHYFWKHSNTLLERFFAILCIPLMAVAIMGRAWFLTFKSILK